MLIGRSLAIAPVRLGRTLSRPAFDLGRGLALPSPDCQKAEPCRIDGRKSNWYLQPAADELASAIPYAHGRPFYLLPGSFGPFRTQPIGGNRAQDVLGGMRSSYVA